MPAFVRRLMRLLRWSRHNDELCEEMETHRALRQDRLERDGASSSDARAASLRAMGNVTLAREDARDAWMSGALDRGLQDLRTVFRGLRRSPGFTAITVGTLALGIGANTALFSLCNSLLFRPLPVRDPASLILIDGGPWTYPIWQAIDRRADQIVGGAFAWAGEGFNISTTSEATLVDGAYVSGGAFNLLGLQAARGRLLMPSDDQRTAESAVAVVSHRFWFDRLGGGDDVVGRSLTLNRVPFTIVGVMPAGFFGPDVGRAADVIIPFGAEPLIRGSQSALDVGAAWWIEIMARLKPGQSREHAEAALRAAQPQIRAEAMPNDWTGDLRDQFLSEPFAVSSAGTGQSSLRGRFGTPLLAMLAVVGLVLLIACANVANLLLGRALTRRQELGVRLALGASRWRVARLLVAESLVLTIAGALLGLVFATSTSAFLVSQLTTWRVSVYLDLALDWRVLGFTTLVASATALMAALVPALSVKRVGPGEALKAAGRSVAGDGRLKLRGALIVTQIALSLTLLVAAGLFLRTFASISRVPLGFSPDPLVVASLNLDASAAPPETRGALAERVRQAVATIPGVTSAALSDITPVTGAGWNAGVGRDTGGRPDRSRMTWRNAVSPGWFATMGMRIVAGRDFDTTDRPESPRVAVVNELFARRFLTSGAPVGQEFMLSGPRSESTFVVVGVVNDAVYRSLREGQVPTAYVPAAQRPNAGTGLTLAIAPGQRVQVLRVLAERIQSVDPAVTFSVRTFDQFIRATMVQERLVALLSTFFGGLGLLLAGLGLYGVVSNAVNARRTEIGVRMALGADPRGIVWLIFRRVGALLLAGAVIGGGLSLWASQFLETMLFQLDARDPVTFAAALAVLATAVVLAGWWPARRAARIDPARVLREG